MGGSGVAVAVGAAVAVAVGVGVTDGAAIASVAHAQSIVTDDPWKALSLPSGPVSGKVSVRR